MIREVENKGKLPLQNWAPLKSKANKLHCVKSPLAEGFQSEDGEDEVGVVPSVGSGRLQSSATTDEQWLEVRKWRERRAFLSKAKAKSRGPFIGPE